jgi:predicted ATPase/DNA-binding winged helix-turn-helix (wHTH) protein
MHKLDRPGVFSFGPFRLHVVERLLERGNEAVPLGGRALDLLIALVEHAGQVVGRSALMSRVWPDVTVEEANLRVHIAALRKALGDGHEGARYIVNATGRGYSFVAPVTFSAPDSPAPNPAGVSDRLQKLPARLTRMVGRDEAVRVLSSQLMIWRFVSLVGPGGIGKTTVAVSVAHALVDSFGAGAFFVDLGTVTDLRLVPGTVASAMGFMLQAQDQILSLLAFIADKKILLVLDSCEHVIDAAAPLAERVVSAAPHAHVLVTSREALRARGEHVHLLHPLDSAPEYAGLTAAEALSYPATQLFMDRARASGHDSPLSDAEASVIARLCHRLDGIPLAIELAASCVGVHGIQGTAELLDYRFLSLWQGRRTALQRHQTLNAMLDWSYNLLSEHEKLVLRRLSVFVGGFTLQAARSVVSEADTDEADSSSVVVSLVAKSLISTNEINRSIYYRLLDTTRAYASAKLAEHGEADMIARRHAITYSGFLEHDATIQSIFGRHDLSGYIAHIGNVRAALKWALAGRGDVAAGIELATWAASLFIGLSLLEECRHWCERALAALDDAGRGTRQEMILQEAVALSSIFTKGHDEEVRSAIERGLVLGEDLQDRPRQQRLLALLTLYLQRRGDYRGSRAAVEQGGVIARVANFPPGIIWTEWMIGTAHCLQGSQATAQLHFERAMALETELGTTTPDWFGYTRVGILVGRARALWLRGFSDQAGRAAETALYEAARQHSPLATCVSLLFASTVFLWIGDLPRVAELIDQLIAYTGRYSLRPHMAAGMALKGELAIASGAADVGVELLGSAVQIMRAEQYNVNITAFMGTFADGLRKTGRLDDALLTTDRAIAQATESGTAFWLAELLRIKALTLACMPQPDLTSAMDCLAKSLALACEQSALALELRSATTLARLLSESGHSERARNILSPVYNRFTEGFDTADLRCARQLLDDLA